jgi:hypothetical protein
VRILDGIALAAFLLAMVALAYGVLAGDKYYAPRGFVSGLGVAMLVFAINPFLTGVIRFKGGRNYFRRDNPRQFYRKAVGTLVAIVAIVTGITFLAFVS